MLNPLPSPLPVVVTPPPPVPKPPAKDPKMPKDGEPKAKKTPPAQYHSQRSLRLKVDGDVTDSGEASADGIHTRMGM